MRQGTDDHQAVRQRQPYGVVLDGLHLTVAEDVFPPDVGYTTRNLGRMLNYYHPLRALDMGCGTGYLAMVLRRNGVPDVWAADVRPQAVACCLDNLERNPDLKPVTVIQSDLFENVKANCAFDLIVFNQPFFPCTDDEFLGAAPDGGAGIIRRFLDQARSFLSRNGVILMPFQDTAGLENDPAEVARALCVRTIFRETEWSTNRFVYELSYPS